MEKKWFGFFSLIVLGFFLMGCLMPPEGTQGAKEIPKFGSCSAIKAAFDETANQGYYGGWNVLESISAPMAGASGAQKGTDGSDSVAGGESYSTTNVQVQGVDEADIVKTDGKYIYTLSNGKLAITDAFPVEGAKVLSLTELGEMQAQEMFIHGDRVLVFGQEYVEMNGPVPYNGDDVETVEKKVSSSEMIVEEEMPYRYGKEVTVVMVFNTTDKTEPELERKLELEGYYVSSRKIGEEVYFVVNSYPERYYWAENPEEEGEILPVYRDSKQTSEEFEPVCGCEEVGYLEPMNAQTFVTIASISMENPMEEITKETVVGSGQNVYASMDNLYLAEVNYSTEPRPLWEGGMESSENTEIHRFSLHKGEIGYDGSMQAPGRILNQFSMDEFDSHFRIATTVGRVSRSGGQTGNNVYVFGNDLKLKGKLEGLAPGESIYSARFMGKKAYLVTFKKIDPLFVIDLTNPAKPEVLGKLKIPGYSDYLHPMDETHLIGIGKHTIEAEEERGDFAWYQGVKIAIFDVSDVENPIELHKTIIGDRGTESYALQDHKAFLYDNRKELLVVPITLAELSEAQKQSGASDSTHGEYTFQGAYVYNLTLENGFDLKGRISHADPESFKKSGYYYYGGGDEVQRALYIEDILYTISENKILANALSDLALLKELVLTE